MKQTAYEYWESRFGAPPKTDSELLAVAMMHEYAESQKPKLLKWVDDGVGGFVAHPPLKEAFFHITPDGNFYILYSKAVRQRNTLCSTIDEAKALAQQMYAEQVAKLYEKWPAHV